MRNLKPRPPKMSNERRKRNKMEERNVVKFKKKEFSVKEYIKKSLGKGKISKVKIEYRSEEHTSELQSHSFISYAVFCLKKKK